MWSSRLHKLLKLNHTEQYHVIYSGSRLSKPWAGSTASDQHQNCIEGSLFFNKGVKTVLVDKTVISYSWYNLRLFVLRTTLTSTLTMGFLKYIGRDVCTVGRNFCCETLYDTELVTIFISVVYVPYILVLIHVKSIHHSFYSKIFYISS